MTQALEESEVERLRAVLAGATPGPWVATERSGYHELLAPDATCDWYGREKMHAVAYCDTEIDEVEQIANAALIVAAVNALPALLADRDELLSSLSAANAVAHHIDEFAKNYFAPWGSWKTAWWEGEVSDDAAFSDHNALKHVANIAAAFLARLEPAKGEGGDG